MIAPLLMGAGVKLITNVVNTWMHNSAEERRTNALKDTEICEAHIALAKSVNSDKLAKVSRSVIFMAIIFTWCYMGIYGLHNPEMQYDIVLPKSNNWTITSLFSSSNFEIRKISGSVLMWQWFSLTEMILGFFVVPSRRR